MTMGDLHSILKRQIKKHFGGGKAVPKDLRPFIEAIDGAYRDFDDDRKMLERSLELTSEEMRQTNEELHDAGERLRIQNDMLLRLARDRSMKDSDEAGYLREIIEIAARTLKSDMSTLWLSDGADENLLCRYSVAKEGIAETPDESFISRKHHRAFFKALESAQSVALCFKDSDKEIASPAKTHPRLFAGKHVLAAPIHLNGKAAGALVCGRHAGTFHPEEQRFALSMADFITITLEHRKRERTEQDLLNLKELELSLLRANPHGVVGLRDRKIIFANESVRDVFGWEPDELIGNSTRILYKSDEDYETIASHFYPVLQEKAFHSEIFPCVKKDGTEITCRVSATRIGDSLTDRRIIVIYENITASIETARAVEAQKRFTEYLLQSIEVPAFVIDKNHRVLIWNTACEHMTGKKAEDIIGTDRHWTGFYETQRPTLADIVIEGKYDELAPLYQFYSRSMFIENSWHGEGWYDNLGGKRRYMFFDAVPVFDEKGELIAAIETLQDISERKLAEEALRDSENRYRAIFESTGTAMLMIEEDTTISLTNTEFQRLTGYAAHEIEGKMSWTVFIVPEDLERMKTYHRKRRDESGLAPTSYEFRLINRNGETNDMFLSITMIPGTKKSVASLIDITQLKNAERQMERMRFYLQNIIDSMPSILIGVDREGRITQWNSAACNDTGLPVETVLGTPLAESLPWFAPMIQNVHKAMAKREILKTERIPRQADKSLRYVDVTVYPLIWNDIEGAVVLIDDVTKRVRLDDMIIQTEKMISVGGLAAGMAHEINNPLSGILMGVENVTRRLSPGLARNIEVAEQCGVSFDAMQRYMEKREVLKMIESIREMGMRAAVIVANMLSFSRQSSSRPVQVDMVEILNRTLGLAQHDYDLKKKYDFRHIEIIKEYEEGPLRANCIPTEIEQVLLNLLRNAAQEMTRKEFTGKKPRIVLRLKTEDHFIRIEVEDNGPGMKEEVRKRIFEPFYTTKEPGVGTGLGLSVSYFIITNNHRGSLTVESEPGKGARFIILLPR